MIFFLFQKDEVIIHGNVNESIDSKIPDIVWSFTMILMEELTLD